MPSLCILCDMLTLFLNLVGGGSGPGGMDLQSMMKMMGGGGGGGGGGMPDMQKMMSMLGGGGGSGKR